LIFGFVFNQVKSRDIDWRLLPYLYDRGLASPLKLTIFYSTDQFFPCFEKSIGAKNLLGTAIICLAKG